MNKFDFFLISEIKYILYCSYLAVAANCILLIHYAFVTIRLKYPPQRAARNHLWRPICIVAPMSTRRGRLLVAASSCSEAIHASLARHPSSQVSSFSCGYSYPHHVSTWRCFKFSLFWCIIVNVNLSVYVSDLCKASSKDPRYVRTNEYEFYEIYIAVMFLFIATIVVAGGHNLCFFVFLCRSGCRWPFDRPNRARNALRLGWG